MDRSDRWASRLRLAGLAAALIAQSAWAEDSSPRHFTAPQMFDIAARADAAGNLNMTEVIYRALEHNPDVNIRNEARFRHAGLLERRKSFADAAVLLRSILDETPAAKPARLELAKVLALMGHESAARRELRQAEVGGLPPDVQRIVNQFAAALRAARPYGGSLEIGMASSNNINRATSTTTLNSTLGPLDLSNDARARSGVGANLSGQGYIQVPVSQRFALTGRLATQNALYRASQFNDSTFSGELGASMSIGQSRLRLSAGPSYRLYGAHPFSFAVNVTLDWQHPLGKRSAIDLESDFSTIDYKVNALQNGQVFGETLAIDHAFSPRFGGKLSLYGQRATAADPGYATAMGGAGLLLWREIGSTTVYWNGSVSHLQSDDRLFLYTDRRREWLYRTGVGATFRHFKVKGFAPLLRVNYERNASSVGIYDYHRVSADLAITRAF